MPRWPYLLLRWLVRGLSKTCKKDVPLRKDGRQYSWCAPGELPTDMPCGRRTHSYPSPLLGARRVRTHKKPKTTQRNIHDALVPLAPRYTVGHIPLLRVRMLPTSGRLLLEPIQTKWFRHDMQGLLELHTEATLHATEKSPSSLGQRL